MKYNKFTYITRLKFRAIAAIIAMVAILAMSSAAQGTKDTELAAGVTLEQCRNGGTLATAVPCDDAGGSGGWVSGNTGQSNSHWAENQFVPYRMKFTGLSVGSPNTVIIGYDILKGAIHAIDYLGDYDQTETTADPCGVVPGCSGYMASTLSIPEDTANLSPTQTQIPGAFKLWGGAITSVGYVNCPSASAEERCISVTFTANQTNPVLAWGGHIAWRGDWGVGNSAGGINGSPYHMRLISLNGNGGNQDRSLAADAVIASGSIRIIKDVTTSVGGTASPVSFGFTAVSGFDPLNFSLIDNNDGSGNDTKLSQEITSFGMDNRIVVSENDLTGSGWTLANIMCVGGSSGYTVDYPTRSATITVEQGETVVCTFSNTQLAPSAAGVTVSGRVVRPNGSGIPRVNVVVSDGQGYFRSAITNGLGYYQIDEVEAGNTYILSANSKQFTFAPRLLSLTDNIVVSDIISIE